MIRVIMDTGPLVAWFCKRDLHHAWARDIMDRLPVGACVCEAVLTETCHLVARDGVPPAAVLKLVDRGDLLAVSRAVETRVIHDFMEQYADTPMDFADACVTRLADLHDDAAVLTTDSDFLVYRKSSGAAIPLIAPFVPEN